jgi:hypothetical protein
MKTPVELAIEVIADLPTEVLSAQSLKEVIVSLLRDKVMQNEREHLILAFMEGQATPKASFQLWFDRTYSKPARVESDIAVED